MGLNIYNFINMGLIYMDISKLEFSLKICYIIKHE